MIVYIQNISNNKIFFRPVINRTELHSNWKGDIIFIYYFNRDDI